MSDFAQEERHPVFPTYLVIDVSGSMDGSPIQAVNGALPRLKQVIQSDPAVGEIARIGVVTFSDSARLVLPLCDIAYADPPVLRTENMTNFAAAFRVTRAELEAGIRGLGKGTRFHKPVVFFMSDGYHNANEPWAGAHMELTNREWKFCPEIVVFGFGEANAEELQRIATRYAFMAKHDDPAEQVREIFATLIRSIRTTSQSLQSGAAGGLIVQPDPNKFTPLPVGVVD
jgi:uncharacterized protein YegL